MAEVDGLFSPSYIQMTFASLLSHYPVPIMGKPYYLSHPSFAIKNSRQEEAAKVGVMRLEGWLILIAPLFDNKEQDIAILMVAR
ncbi:MAG: hypothetical protein E4G89_06010 [Methanothrix sp.]|nr:MAG: hypothetical protein E4G89_06010 [Methanothrix sp.]